MTGQTPRSVAIARSARRPHFVYHCFDDADRLLYVGCTSDFKARVYQHQHAKPAAALASRILSARMARVETVAEYPDRQSAQKAEAWAIETLRPILNFQGARVPSRMTTQGIVEYLAECGIDPEAFDLTTCEHCKRRRHYRAKGSMCSDCRDDPEFRAYITAKRAS